MLIFRFYEIFQPLSYEGPDVSHSTDFKITKNCNYNEFSVVLEQTFL
jgi:hypothetical protein